MPTATYTFAGYDHLGIPVMMENRETTQRNAIAVAEMLLMMDAELGSIEVLQPIERRAEETVYWVLHTARLPWN